MILTANNLIKSYDSKGNPIPVLQNLSMSIEENEFVAMMGPSGCGKSTLLYVLSGMEFCDQGEVFFDGCSLRNLKDDDRSDLRRQKMGFVFQQPTFLQNLNLLDNIILPSLRDHTKDRIRLIKKAQSLMAQANISSLSDRFPPEVSGGQLQRAGICRALMNHPKLIFCDEPTGALDSKSTKDILNLFSWAHHNNSTILMVTHDPAVAARADRILFMKDGQITEELLLGTYREEDAQERIRMVSKKMIV